MCVSKCEWWREGGGSKREMKKYRKGAENMGRKERNPVWAFETTTFWRKRFSACPLEIRASSQVPVYHINSSPSPCWETNKVSRHCHMSWNRQGHPYSRLTCLKTTLSSFWEHTKNFCKTCTLHIIWGLERWFSHLLRALAVLPKALGSIPSTCL